MKALTISILLLITALIFSGCSTKDEENILFLANLESIEGNTWLVSTTDDVGFEKARVTITEEVVMPFNPLVGQTLSITILPKINESNPVQVTAIAVALVQTEELAFQYTKITAEEAKAIIDTEKDFILVDVRTEEEFESGYIEGAVLLPLDEIETLAEEYLPSLNQKILLYCRSGNRSETAARLLGEMGYTNVLDFGGINDWPYEIVQ